MAELMIRFDDLRRYCEKRHCGSVPLEYIKQMPTIEADIDRAAILRLCNEIEMIIVTVCDTGYTLQNGDVEAIIKRTKAIRTELTGDAEPVRHGRWIPIEYDSYADGAPVWDKWECSECGHEHKGEEDTLTAFCPDCGERMNLRTPTEAQIDEADNVMMRGADNG